MADETKTAVFKVEVDFGDLEKNQSIIKSRINEIRNEQLQLDASSKENQKTFKENNATLKTLEAQLKLNQKALNDLSNAEKSSTDRTNFANNSIKQNRELLKELNAEYIRLQNPTKEQTANLKTLTDTLKAQESAIGDNRRNVGNYADSLKGALSEGLKSALGGIKGLNAGLLASPIGLITQGIQLLVGAFGGLEPVVDFVEQKVALLTAGFKTLVGGISGFVSALFSGSDVTQAYSENIEGLGAEIANTATEAQRLTKALQDLEDAESEALVTTAKNNAEVSKLLIQAKDRTKTEQERLALLARAGEIEKENFKIELENSLRSEAIAQKQLALAIKNGEDTGEIRRKANEATAQRIALEGQSAELQERIAVRRNQLIEGESTAREQARTKRQAQIEKEKAEEEKRVAEAIKRAEELKKAFEDTTNAEFEFTQQATETFFAEQDARLREQLATRQITITEFNKQVEENNALRLETELQTLLDYQSTVGGLEDEIAKKKVEISNFATSKAIENIKKEQAEKEKEDKAEKDRLKARNLQLAQYTEATTMTFIGALTQQGDFLKNYQKATAGLILDILEKQAIGSATIQAFASPESVATAGVAGAIKAGIIVGLIKGAFGVARSAINGFADGGLVEGFAGGGLSGKRITSSDGKAIRRSNGDNILATVKTGEVILNERQQQALGGPSTFARIGVPGFADGGSTSFGLQAMRSNVQAEQGLQPIVEAIRDLQISVSVTEIQEVSKRLDLQAQVAEL